MNKNEIRHFLDYMQNAYKFQNKSVEVNEEIWYDNFACENVVIFNRAVKVCVATNKYFPAISEMHEIVDKIKQNLKNQYITFKKYQVNIPERCKGCEVDVEDGFAQWECAKGNYCYKTVVKLRNEKGQVGIITKEQAVAIEQVLGKEYLEKIIIDK